MRDAWWQLYCHLRNTWYFYGASALHMACYLGITTWVAKLLRSKTNLLLGRFTDQRIRPTKLSPLHYAALGGHAAVVTLLLQHRAKIDGPDSFGQTALCLAVQWSHPTVIQVLLRHGADVRLHESSHGTVLQFAASEGQVPAMRQLLDHPFDVNLMCDRTGNTPLHAASNPGRLDMMQCLLEYGAKVDSRNTSLGQTPLHLAVADGFGKTAAARLLIERGATIDARQINGATPLHRAANCGMVAAARLLVQNGAAINAKTLAGETPLQHAMEFAVRCAESAWRSGRGSKALVQMEVTISFLLQCGAWPDSLSARGGRPLEQAWDLQNAHLVRILVAHGADVNLKPPKQGYTLLHWASGIGDSQLMQTLFDHGADLMLHTTDHNGQTPLHLAILGLRFLRWKFKIENSTPIPELCTASGSRHAEPMARLLLDRGAEVDIQDFRGMTALHYAVEVAIENATCILLERGADPNVKATDGKTPLEIAIERGDDALIHILVEAGAQEE